MSVLMNEGAARTVDFAQGVPSGGTYVARRSAHITSSSPAGSSPYRATRSGSAS
jgi:hypothetical protein